MVTGEFFRQDPSVELTSVASAVSEHGDAIPSTRTANDEVGGVSIEAPLPAEAQDAQFQAPTRSPSELLIDLTLDLPALVV